VILIDTSVWIDHFRITIPELLVALSEGRVIQHPFVTAEIALGNIRDRQKVTALLNDLPQAQRCEDSDFLAFVSGQRLHGTGLGMVDAHLLATVISSGACKLWTRDKKLADKADKLHCLYNP
jgi:predicted nucleic acid-binding protein